jgi:hypothetical protein
MRIIFPAPSLVAVFCKCEIDVHETQRGILRSGRKQRAGRGRRLLRCIYMRFL